MSGTTRHIYWQSLEEPGLEHLCLEISECEIKAIGFILRKIGELHLRNRYELTLGPDWQLRRASVGSSESGGQAKPKTLVLERDEAGTWLRDGEELPGLAGCQDIDIEITPFTNSLPVRRLDLAAGESAEVEVAYVAFPELAVGPARQRYSCLERGANGSRYRYENPASGFTAELDLDRDGLVLDYPALFQRSWPS